MKKALLLSIFAVAAIGFSFAANNNDSTQMLGVHPFKANDNVNPKMANWSIGLDAGFSMLDGDFVQPDITILPTTKIRPTGSFYLSYDFTPVWGIRGVYTYANYGVKQKETGLPLIDNGHMHSLEALLTFDLVDACFPRRKTDIFSAAILFGGGLGFYNCDYHVPGTEAVIHPRSNNEYDMAGLVSVGVMFEFNVSRIVALNIKGMYHISTKDNLDARIRGNNNDLMENVSGGIRFKLEGRKKSHVLNVASLDNMLELTQKDRKALKDTLVVMHSDTVYVIDSLTNTQMMLQTLIQQGDRREDCRYVYFDHDKYTLSDMSLRTIQQLAAELDRNPDMCVELRGYCDYTGTEAYNATLGQRRADRVKQELQKVYGIDNDRILAVGLGRLNNVSKAYAPNRRCEMRLVKRDRLEELRAEHSERLANQQPAAPSANVDKANIITTVTVKKNVTTLSRLARKYYGNTHCWAYIYLANTDVIDDPDKLEEGTKLVIPVLTADQKKITADQVNIVLGR